MPSQPPPLGGSCGGGGSRCPVRGSKGEEWKDVLMRREDDTEEVVRERLKVYETSSLPVLEYYRSGGSSKIIDFVVFKGIKDAPAMVEAMKVAVESSSSSTNSSSRSSSSSSSSSSGR